MDGIEHPGRDAKTGFDNVNRFSEELDRYIGEAKNRNKPIGIVYIAVSAKAPHDIDRVAASINELVRDGCRIPDEIVHQNGHFYLTYKISTDEKCKIAEQTVAQKVGQHKAIAMTGYKIIQPDTKQTPQEIISELEKLSSVA